MPVKFILKPAPWPLPSNKPEGNEGDGKQNKKRDIAYTYKVVGKGLVYVTCPFIDKISLTLPITDPDEQGMIQEAINFDGKDSDYPFVKPSKEKGGYKYASDIIDPATGEAVWLQADPKPSKAKKNQKKNFVRIEFNPTKIGPDGLKALKSKLSEMTFGVLTWKRFIAEGKVTRIDVTADLLNAFMGDLLYQSHSDGKNHMYVGLNGDLETAYLGLTKAKNTNQVVYNKTQDEIDKGEPAKFGGNCSRVEMIYTSGHTMFQNMAAIKSNPFERVTVYHPGTAPAGVDETAWMLFMDSCRLRGLDKALDRLPQKMREIVDPHLAHVGAKTWNPDKLWSLWGDTVKSSELLKA